MALIVQKFGGSSVADADKIHRSAKRVVAAQDGGKNQVVVVVSAMGDTTDDLLTLAHKVCQGHNPAKREMDMLLATGEQVSIALFAMALHAQGHQAISLTGPQVGLSTDNAHTKARIKKIEAERIHRHLREGCIVIVAGFQGVNELGDVTTLGRGGSDTTAVALAAALKADECEIYTDVKGIYTTDPRIVKDARLIHRISYDEMLELTSVGGGKMHSRSIEFGKKYGVKIHVRHSQLPEDGTWIVEETPEMEDITVRGCALKKDLGRVTLRGVPDRPGVAATIFANIAAANIMIDDIIQTELPDKTANMSCTFEEKDRSDIQPILDKLLKEFPGTSALYDAGLAKISVVGVGMRTHTGVAQKMFGALALGKINIQNISTSEIRISCIIRAEDGERALQLVHQAFGLDQA